MTVACIKSMGVKGAAVYKLNESGTPILGNYPNIDNVPITLPAIEPETTSLNLMGTLDVPDISRIGNMQMSITVPCDNDDAMSLAEMGTLQSWLIAWVSQEYDVATSQLKVVPYKVYVKGFVASLPNAEVNAGAENTGDITMNLVSIKKLRDNVVKYNIDRTQGLVEIDGKNLTSQFNSLY